MKNPDRPDLDAKISSFLIYFMFSAFFHGRLLCNQNMYLIQSWLNAEWENHQTLLSWPRPAMLTGRDEQTALLRELVSAGSADRSDRLGEPV